MIISADLVFTANGPPIAGGGLETDDNGRITRIFRSGQVPPHAIVCEGILCPGFINAHGHLELSHLRGRIRQGLGLDQFIREISRPGSNSDELPARQEAIAKALDEMIENGIVAAADIVNTPDTINIKRSSQIRWYNLVEVYGSDPAEEGMVFDHFREIFHQFRIALPAQPLAMVPHSPYSLTAGLFRMIKTFAEENGGVYSMHHQENEDENEYFKYRTGPVTRRIHDFGIDNAHLTPSGKAPIPTLLHLLPESQPLLLVHNTVSQVEDVEFIMENIKDPWFCLCPNANLYIEDRLPDLGLFLRYSGRVVLGTDSLASNHQLSILEEMKTLAAGTSQPAPPLETLISWATINGARLLGMSNELGSLELGKKPGIVLIEGADTVNAMLTPGCRARRIA